jgi:CDGSH-type Zn-finger protein
MVDKIEITARENGPYLIPLSGTATFVDAQGKSHSQEGNMVALCRCGQSGNKPFCDGSHKKVAFQALGGILTLNAE